MKKCSNSLNQKCNSGEDFGTSVVTGAFIKVGSTGSINFKQIENVLVNKNNVLKLVKKYFDASSGNAKERKKIPQNLVNFSASAGGICITLRQYLDNNKLSFEINKINLPFLTKLVITICEKGKYNRNNREENKNKRGSEDHTLVLSSFQNKATKKHHEAFRILLSGDVEPNPGPGNREVSNERGKKVNSKDLYHSIEVTTYNCRGLKEYKKLKRVLNTCANIVKRNPLSITFLQETHLDSSAESKLNVMWRGKAAISPGEGGSRGCITLCGDSWQVVEKYAPLDGRLIVLAIKTEQISIITINIYAPNNHDILFFEEVFNKLIEFRDKYPEYLIIVAGDLNLVLDPLKDAVNRNMSKCEIISSNLFKENAKVLELVDGFRRINNGGGFSWSRGKTFSRLDYIFMSEDLGNLIHEAKVDWSFDRSDHAAVTALVRIPKIKPRGPGLSKVNADVLKNQAVKEEFIIKLNEMLADIPDNWDPNRKLEFLKVATRSIMGEIAGKQKRLEDIEFKAISEQLNRLQNNYAECLSKGIEIPLASETISALKIEIEKFLEIKAQKLAEKAKSKWFDEGEKSNKYFLNLLNRRRQETTINEIWKDSKKANSQEEIEALVVEFYGELYDVDTSLKDNYDFFFPDLPRLTEEDRKMLDKEITLEELRQTLSTCQESAPGPDGIPYLVYKECWEVYGPFILNSWNHCKLSGKLQEFNRSSSITLIPKEGKDPKLIGNWRPITLTNCDLKIFTKLLANRVAKVLPKILLESQVAYVPGRAVQDNLRMFEFFNSYCEKHNIESVIISLDAAKAFDSVDHKYMFETLRRFGFSEEFIESCALFIICLDPVLRNIEQNKKIKCIELKTPLTNQTVKNKTGAYADDVGTVVKNDPESINNVFKEYAKFSEYSGLRLNEEKSEIMILNEKGRFIAKDIEIDNGIRRFKLKTVEKVKICGVTFSANKSLSHKENILDKIDKMERNLIMWLHRGLTLLGKVVIINTFGISQLIYTMQVCEYYDDDLKRIEGIIFKFLWNKKWIGNKAPDRIKRDIIKRSYEEGGLKVPDIKNINSALKLKQFLRSMKSKHPIRTVQKYVIEKLDYDFVYQQEYSRITEIENVTRMAQLTINRLTDEMRKVKVSEFNVNHVNLIAAIDVVEYLERKKHSLALCYFKNLFRLGIEKYSQLVRESKFPRSDNIKKLAEVVLKSFPKEWLELTELDNINEDIIPYDFIPVGGKTKKRSEISVKDIKIALLGKKQADRSFPFNIKLGIVNHENINPFIASRVSNHSVALRFFKYRLLHCDIYTKERMLRFKMTQDDLCDFCGRREDIKHMLWDCTRVKVMWENINAVFADFVDGRSITFETIFVGYAPTEPILESIITRITRSIVARDRSNPLSENVIKQEMVEHCICNIYRLTKVGKSSAKWKEIKGLIESRF